MGKQQHFKENILLFCNASEANALLVMKKTMPGPYKEQEIIKLCGDVTPAELTHAFNLNLDYLLIRSQSAQCDASENPRSPVIMRVPQGLKIPVSGAQGFHGIIRSSFASFTSA